MIGDKVGEIGVKKGEWEGVVKDDLRGRVGRGV